LLAQKHRYTQEHVLVLNIYSEDSIIGHNKQEPKMNIFRTTGTNKQKAQKPDHEF
jgi:hypothetical protein